jgi:AcrR family transcriptional regulator
MAVLQKQSTWTVFVSKPAENPWHTYRHVATQAERTSKMRARLLGATVRSLLDLGYTRTSTTEVCRRAKVSRGAQLHHFPTKAELVAAAVEHVFEERLRDFQRFVERLRNGAPPDLATLYEHLWREYSGEAFYAWIELLVACRTDAALRPHVRAVDRRFSEGAHALLRATFGGVIAEADIPAVTRMVMSLFDGLAMHRIVDADDAGALAVLRLFARVARPSRS